MSGDGDVLEDATVVLAGTGRGQLLPRPPADIAYRLPPGGMLPLVNLTFLAGLRLA